MLESFTVGTFEGRVGEAFRAAVEGHEPLELTLVSAEKTGEGSEDRPFSVVFRGPRGVRLGQGIVQMEHGEVGAFALFLVPIRPDAEGPLYEAVFN